MTSSLQSGTSLRDVELDIKARVGEQRPESVSDEGLVSKAASDVSWRATLCDKVSAFDAFLPGIMSALLRIRIHCYCILIDDHPIANDYYKVMLMVSPIMQCNAINMNIEIS